MIWLGVPPCGLSEQCAQRLETVTGHDHFPNPADRIAFSRRVYAKADGRRRADTGSLTHRRMTRHVLTSAGSCGVPILGRACDLAIPFSS
jgi:hypothetical protein